MNKTQSKLFLLKMASKCDNVVFVFVSDAMSILNFSNFFGQHDFNLFFHWSSVSKKSYGQWFQQIRGYQIQAFQSGHGLTHIALLLDITNESQMENIFESILIAQNYNLSMFIRLTTKLVQFRLLQLADKVFVSKYPMSVFKQICQTMNVNFLANAMDNFVCIDRKTKSLSNVKL